jgi:ammonia channel protein AmtB
MGSLVDGGSSTSSLGMEPGQLFPGFDTGDTAMMVFATAFVMMQTPAMGLCQAGMIRRKNCMSMMMQTLSGMAIGSLLWFFVGYSLAFGNSANGLIGNPFAGDFRCLRGRERYPTGVSLASLPMRPFEF